MEFGESSQVLGYQRPPACLPLLFYYYFKSRMQEETFPAADVDEFERSDCFALGADGIDGSSMARNLSQPSCWPRKCWAWGCTY